MTTSTDIPTTVSRPDRRTRWLAALAAIAFLALVLIMLRPPEAIGAPTTDVENVKDYGAVGNGTTDDTTAFQNAITASNTSKKPVYVPAGKYKITQTLSLNGRSMVGDTSGSWTSDSQTLSTILPTNAANSAVRLLDGGAIQGLNFEYVHSNPNVPTQFAATVLLDGVGTKVQDVRIYRPWIGIDTAPGTDNTGRALIQNVFISNVAKLGIRLDEGFDVTTLDNVEVWTPSGVLGNSFGNSGTGIILHYNDALRMDDVFVYGAATGILFDDSSGGTWGNMTNVSTDFCATGIKVAGTHHLTYAGGTSWAHNYGMFIDGEYADVTITGAEFRANSGAALRVTNAWSVTLGASSLQRDQTSGSGPVIHAEGSKSFVATGNFLNGRAVGVEIGAGMQNIILTNNMINVTDGTGVGVQNGGPGGMTSIINDNIIK